MADVPVKLYRNSVIRIGTSPSLPPTVEGEIFEPVNPPGSVSLHDPVSIGTPANGLSISGQVLSLGLASSSTIGALSSTDWTTFNEKPDQEDVDIKANTDDLAQVAFSGDYNDLINAPVLQLEEFELNLVPWVFDGNITHPIPDGSEFGETWTFVEVTYFFWRGSYPTRGLVVFYPAIDGKSITLYPDKITPNVGDKIYLTIKYAR